MKNTKEIHKQANKVLNYLIESSIALQNDLDHEEDHHNFLLVTLNRLKECTKIFKNEKKSNIKCFFDN